jgi:hypothetical protein
MPITGYHRQVRCKLSTSLQFTHDHFQHRRTLTDFLSDPVPVFKGPWNILDLPDTNGSLLLQIKAGCLVFFFTLLLPPASLTQHMHFILHSQTNSEIQAWEVIVDLYCFGSTVDLKQVYGQIVTACNCYEEEGFE